MFEVGIYRVSGSASDLARLKKAFETSKNFVSILNLIRLLILNFHYR